MFFHNRSAKAAMEAVIVLGKCSESFWQVGVELNPTATSGGTFENKQIYVLINSVSLTAAGSDICQWRSVLAPVWMWWQ